MRMVAAAACIIGSAGLAAAQDVNRLAFLPTVRAATACVATVISKDTAIPRDNDDRLREAARRAFGGACQTEGQRLVFEHDRLYGSGTGRQFVDGPYFTDLPRAVRVRLTSAQPLVVPLNAKPRRCPDMLEIYEVQDAGREFARLEQNDLQRRPKSDLEVLNGFIGRMDQQLQQARHAMARPVLQEFRSLPPADMGICFPTLVPVMAEARTIAAQAEEMRLDAERQRAEAEARRIEQERLAEERRLEVEYRRQIALRAEEERRAEERRIADERRKQEREEAERRRIAEERAEEDRRRDYMRPVNVLKRSYAQYAFIRRCVEFGKGNVYAFVSEPQFTRARAAIKAIEDKIKVLDPGIGTEIAWGEAAQSVLNTMPIATECQTAHQTLISTFETMAPELAVPKKDF